MEAAELMRALVTGANGLVGANLVRALLCEGHDVCPLVRANADRSSLEGLPVTPRVGDVLTGDGLGDAVRGCDLVFHTAVPFAFDTRSPARLESVAVEGTANVLRAVAEAGVSRAVVTSSSVVFGYRERPEVLDEFAGLADPAGQPAYVAAKIRQDRAAFDLAADLGVELLLVCPTMSVGAHATRLGPSNAAIVQVLLDPIGVTFAGGCNVVAVEDVAHGHLLVATAGRAGQHYLLGGENLAWEQVHDTVAELAGLPRRGLRLNHTLSYLAAGAEELRARIERRPAVTSRSQTAMVGRYYWYDHKRAAALGYRPRDGRTALAEALSWLAASRHVSRETRTTLRLHPDVYAARQSLTAREHQLRSVA